MALLSNIVGFSVIGLAARFGQLGIQRRNLFSNPGGHVVSMAVWGYIGYWVYQWDIRSTQLLEEKRQGILEGRQKKLMAEAAAV